MTCLSLLVFFYFFLMCDTPCLERIFAFVYICIFMIMRRSDIDRIWVSLSLVLSFVFLSSPHVFLQSEISEQRSLRSGYFDLTNALVWTASSDWKSNMSNREERHRKCHFPCSFKGSDLMGFYQYQPAVISGTTRLMSQVLERVPWVILYDSLKSNRGRLCESETRQSHPADGREEECRLLCMSTCAYSLLNQLKAISRG